MLRRELKTDVDMVHGHYGEFKVLVDGAVVVDGGLLAALAIVPSDESILAAVRAAHQGAPGKPDRDRPGASPDQR